MPKSYDYIISPSSTTNFVNNGMLKGVTSNAEALIINVNHETATLRVKMRTPLPQFVAAETIVSNSVVVSTSNSLSVTYANMAGAATVVYGNSYQINGTANSFALPTNNLVFGKDSITVYQNGKLLPSVFWEYPAITALGYAGITLHPIIYRETADSGISSAAYTAGLVGTSTTTEAIRTYIRDTIAQSYSSQSPSVVAIERSMGGPIDPFTYLNAYDLINMYNAGAAYGDPAKVLKMPTYNTTSLTINVSVGNITSLIFTPEFRHSETTTATATISSIDSALFIREKNADQQQPLVRLYTIYYPGELYPPNDKQNPDVFNNSQGTTQWPWPNNFPFRFAEIRGDSVSDALYAVHYDGHRYIPYPINSSGIQIDSTGKINDLNITISNFDNLISGIVEDPFLFGYNSSNNAPGHVNGETCFNIDPRTNPANAFFNQTIVDLRGGYNIAFDYSTTKSLGDTWAPLKQDTRDLLGAVVEIRTTFANFLDYWPEYSRIIESGTGRFKILTAGPYRIGDIIHNNVETMSTAAVQITNIVGDYLFTNNSISFGTGENLYVQNLDASPEDFVLDVFKINSLDGMDEVAAKFQLTSWLQYFKSQLPKRKFLRTCSFQYKGEACKYPASGTGNIAGTTVTANGFFNIQNGTVGSASLDVCAHTETACGLRKNEYNYGGFPSSGLALAK